MTIDERLERLTERHEALTQTVESIAAAQLRADERMGNSWTQRTVWGTLSLPTKSASNVQKTSDSASYSQWLATSASSALRGPFARAACALLLINASDSLA